MDPQTLILIAVLLGLGALAARRAPGAGEWPQTSEEIYGIPDSSEEIFGVPTSSGFYFPIEPTPTPSADYIDYALRHPYPYLPESGGTMTTSLQGVELIKSFEGLRLTAYRDAAGVLTIGYGHTGSDVAAGATITAARAEELLRADLAGAEAAVTSAVQVPVTQGQFDALVSLVYNIGAGAFAASTLLRKLNSGDYAGAAQEFDRWIYAGGSVLGGLVSRRNAEQQLFLAG